MLSNNFSETVKSFIAKDEVSNLVNPIKGTYSLLENISIWSFSNGKVTWKLEFELCRLTIELIGSYNFSTEQR